MKLANIYLPCEPAIPFLGTYLREMKTCPHKDFIHNSQRLKMAPCPPTAESIDNGGLSLQWNTS